MPRPESHDAFDRLKRQLQESILNNYPNPERKGCPGDAVLRGLAARPLDDSLEGDAHWQHVTHCSECYREFLGFRADRRREAKVREAKIAVAAGLLVLLVAAGTFFALRKPVLDRSKLPQNAELVFRHRVLDLRGRAMTRSEEGREDTKPIVLQREPEELAIQLPFGSKAGPYEIQIVRSAGHPLLSAAGDAHITNGTTALMARMDLSKFEPGNYFICVRRVPWDWTCYPLEIR
jgi:hypothetical protein